MESTYTNPRAQACQNCVKAKAKCYGHKDGKCERCNRLSRDCVMQAPTVKKRKFTKPSQHVRAEQIDELHEKVDNLVSLLSGRQAPSIAGSVPSSVVTPESITTPSNHSKLSDFAPVLQPQAGPVPEGHGRAPSAYQGTKTIPGTPDELLDVFRQTLAQLVPFILISPQTTAQNLSIERPFLYRAIIAVTSYHDSVHQMVLGQQLVKEITEQLVLQAQKSLDLLQGLLVYVSWYNGLFHARSQMNTLLGLAFSLMIDLHLYLPMPYFEDHEKFLQEMKGIITCGHRQLQWARQAEPTREERRSILGCFVLFSSASTNFCRINPLEWTPYIQQCYDDILENPENGNDVYLAHLSALYRISEVIRRSGIRVFPSQTRAWNSAVGVTFKLLLSELERFRASLPATLQEDSLMLMHYHSVELYLFEVCFSMPVTDLAQTPGLRRADVLFKCITTTESFLDIYFSVNSNPHIIFFTAFMGQIYFTMMTLSKLLLFDAEDWDPKKVPTAIHLSTVVERLATVLADASLRYDRKEDNKPWFNLSQRIRQIGVLFEHLLASENRSLDSFPLFTQGILGEFNQFDLLDDGFWQSLEVDTAY